MLRYAAPGLFCASLIGCADPSCPEGKQKIGTVCFPIDAGADSAEADDAIDEDASTVAPVAPDAALHDASPGASDGSSQASNASMEGGASGAVSSLCANSNGGCDPLTECSVVAGSVACGACPDGFSGDGASGCQQVPACSNNPCGENAACAASANPPGYACSCKEGFTLEGTTCVDVDECFEGSHACHLTAACENREGSYDCTCPLGYSGGTRAGFACAPRIVAGLEHACVLLSSGQVQCWGDNAKSQLGNQPTRRMPVFVLGLENAVAIAAANSEATCALIDDGTVKCWGDNAQGQLGSGTTAPNAMMPTSVVGLSEVVAIGAGPQHACGVLKDGSVYCWGNDGSGTKLSPVAVPGLPPVATVGLGFTHTCAVTKGGAVWCWGTNEHGQLGGGHTDASSSPVEVPDVRDARYVVGGLRHTCSLDADRRVICWGLDSVNRVAVRGLGSAISLSAGLYNSCAVQLSGAVGCWLVPPDVTASGAATTDPIEAVAVAIAGDNWHACALVGSGAVRCGGNNSSGQLGDGTIMSTEKSSSLVVTTAIGVDAW